MSRVDEPEVAVIGAGPAGLMAAEVAAKAGARVRIYDRMPSAGRKFLMAGRGGLNLTHSEPRPAFLTRYGTAGATIERWIEVCGPEDLRRWCADLGQETFVGSSGRVFPTTLKASPLLRAWLRRLSEQGVELATRHEWRGVDEGLRLSFEAPQGPLSVTPKAVVTALGGASWPKLGSDGRWVEILKAHSIPVTPLQPANCGLLIDWPDIIRDRFAGTPLKGVRLSIGERSLIGEAMISSTGLEGQAVYGLGPAPREASASGDAVLTLDLRPSLSVRDLAAKIARQSPTKSLSNRLRSAGGAPVWPALLRMAMSSGSADPSLLAAALKAIPLKVEGVAGMDRAISSAGGIDLSGVTETMMLREYPGIFVAGEMLDWEAPTGGYLLQACFASGAAAGRAAAAYARGDA